MTGHGFLSAAERAQIEVELPDDPQWAEALREDAEDRRFRRKAGLIAVCGCVAVWCVAAGIVAAGIVAGVLS